MPPGLRCFAAEAMSGFYPRIRASDNAPVNCGGFAWVGAFPCQNAPHAINSTALMTYNPTPTGDTMRKIETTVFLFSELSDDAKEKAREWGRRVIAEDPPWCGEWRDSLAAFCDHFGVTLKEWEVCLYRGVSYTVALENSQFRGMRLKDFSRDHMPTGFCGDCDFWQSFYDEFKRTGDAKGAFDHAVYKGLIAWRDDWEWQLSDEAIEDFIGCNGYEFTEDGERF